MRSVKAFISVILIAALTLAAASCGKAPEKGKTQSSLHEKPEEKVVTQSSLHGKPEENVVTQSTLSAEEQLNKEKLEKSEVFYVMVGTNYDGKTIRLRSFKGVREENVAWVDRTRDGVTYKYKTCGDVNAAWWEHDPNDYEYGDIFIANGIEPEEREEESFYGTSRERYFTSDAKLEKLGNCKTLMTLKKLKIESADYDGYGHWSVHLQDPSEKKDYGYYYGYRNDAYFGVDLSDSDNGTFCTFAFVGDIPIVAVEKGE